MKGLELTPDPVMRDVQQVSPDHHKTKYSYKHETLGLMNNDTNFHLIDIIIEYGEIV